jgi:hypothetical protein
MILRWMIFIAENKDFYKCGILLALQMKKQKQKNDSQSSMTNLTPKNAENLQRALLS